MKILILGGFDPRPETIKKIVEFGKIQMEEMIAENKKSEKRSALIAKRCEKHSTKRSPAPDPISSSTKPIPEERSFNPEVSISDFTDLELAGYLCRMRGIEQNLSVNNYDKFDKTVAGNRILTEVKKEIMRISFEHQKRDDK